MIPTNGDYNSTITRAGLSSSSRKELAIKVITKAEPLTELAYENGVSRKFLYKIGAQATSAIYEAFCNRQDEDKVLFYLPVTKAWLKQVVICLLLICHSSYRGVIELFRAVFDSPISLGTVHNIAKEAALEAREINNTQDLSKVSVGAHDEIFQSRKPVLVGMDVESTYCYLMGLADHRDADTWGIHLLDLAQQGLKPLYTIADAGKGLRAGQAEAWPGIPCHGDVFHMLRLLGQLAFYLERRATGSTSVRQALEHKMERAKRKAQGNSLSKRLACARKDEEKYVNLAGDVRIFADWMQRDILSLAGPDPSTREEMFDFVVENLKVLEPLCAHRIRPVRSALENQKEDLLAFVAVLDEKLRSISREFDIPLHLVYAICEVQGIDEGSTTRWQRIDELHQQINGQFYDVQQAVFEAMHSTHRSSSIVENLNSRLRNYFFLRKHLGPLYLDLLRFFLNHRTFLRSERPERAGKSPAELLAGEKHPHWLELLGFTLLRREAA